ncbi:hypothetical protein COO20_23115 [Thalassospira marina]|uniref:N-acetyltransferase domain-containing protein n=2 Tax=Thalassospira marina TaxID=2048283 RepID=A0A2N3KER3_9PROT|nr:hypothetical protein COO20_23115 [Thalassospira marina]
MAHCPIMHREWCEPPIRNRTMVEIKQARAADRAGWEALWRENIASFGAPDMGDDVINTLWQRIVDPNHPMQAWLAVENGEDGVIGDSQTEGYGEGSKESSRIVGLAHIILHPHTFSVRNVAYLEDFWVSDDQRGKGIGRKMIAALVDAAKQQDWGRLYWLTANDNVAAQRLYDRLADRVDAVLYRIDTA